MAAHGVADQVQLLDFQCLDEGGDAFGLGADIIAGMWLAAVAKARKVEGDNVVAPGEVTGKT
ncbi:hypothetical protein D9M68_761730 [compost metagenome]